MFWNKNKKNRFTPAYPSFAIQKWGSRGYTSHVHVFVVHFPRDQSNVGTLKTMVDPYISRKKSLSLEFDFKS